MRKFLPRTAANPQGFTLIELLVVISIIAILSVVGVTVFTNTQKNSRDTRRKADVDSISKALEANYTSGSATPYPIVTASMFTSGIIPADPQNSGAYVYSGIPAAAATTYTVCTKMESGSGGNASDTNGAAAANGPFYCKKNQQ
ncbi:MAG: type II secretion system protein [Candidatus Daviesbacteria bacterium]|nr:MAG: type II secretion system protein [Candidatus Daviesbacteria bacterium]